MNLQKAEIPLFFLAGLLIIAIFVLLMTGHPVPTYLYAVLGAVLTGGLGLAVPSSTAPEIPAELSALVGDVRKAFASLEEPVTPAPASSTVAPPAPTMLSTVPPGS